MTNTRLLNQKNIRPYLDDKYKLKGSVESYLKAHSSIQVIELQHRFSSIPRTLFHDTRENQGQVTAWDVALSLHPESYLTGYTVLSLLGWTEYIPQVIYVNWVRGIREKADPDRGKIDNEILQQIAFKPKKTPANSFKFGDKEIHFLSGQYLTKAEKGHLTGFPVELELPRYAKTFIAERLFIEALINYHHFGGQELVWQVLKTKITDLDQDRMIKVYQQMKLRYPYANALGYVMETLLKDKNANKKWSRLANRDLRFHLFMGDGERRVYVEQWSLYVPKRFYVGTEA